MDSRMCITGLITRVFGWVFHQSKLDRNSVYITCYILTLNTFTGSESSVG
jgi:hypothetical protein